MNDYNDYQNTEYKDDFYMPKKEDNIISNNEGKKDKPKKNIKDYFNKKTVIIISIILIILIIGIVLIMVLKPKNETSTRLSNILIENNTYEPKFNKDIYDYYLLTDDEEITIECNTKKEIEGCNEKIDLSKYANYIHEIKEDDNHIYKVYIKTKESDSEKNIVINSIEKNENWTNENQIITVNASCDNEIKNYSFDNGLTWIDTNTFEVEKNSELNIIVQDIYGNQSAVRQINIDNIDKNNPSGIIIKEKSSSNEITLKVIGKDEESGIDSYKWSTGSTKDNIKITKKGLYTVTITDKAGNKSEEISIDIKDSDFNKKEQVAITFYSNGASSISNDFLSCTKNNDKCNLTLPSITRENATIIGWSSKKDAKDKEYSVGEKIEIKENMKLYAVTTEKVTAIFNKGFADDITSLKEECTLYNDDKYCFITAPNIIYSSGKIIGWNTNQQGNTVLVSPKSTIKINKNTNYYTLVYKEIIINFNKNGADEISSNKETCRLKNNNASCYIKTPTITKENSNVLGWSTSSEATTASIQANTDLLVNANMNLYAITRKDITITYEKNGSDSITKTLDKCIIYNAHKSCDITFPKINRANAGIIGWSTNKDSKDAEYEEKEKISVHDSKTYYAISYKEVTAKFEFNGSDELSKISEKCSFYNDSNGCSITTADIKREGWTVHGWNTNKNATSETVKEKAKTNIKNDTTFYAITSKKITATFNKNTADSLGGCTNPTSTGCSESCYVYNTNNSCSVKIPYIYSKGNEVQLFSIGTDPSTTTGHTPAKPLSISSNITLNAIVDNRYRKNTYSIIKTKNYGYMAFETESGCPASVYNNYYTFVDRLYSKVPYIFTGAKLTFTGDNSFQKTWGNYSGMTYGIALGYRNIDVKCPNSYSNYYLQTIVHELTHGWDSYYKAKTGLSLSEQPDIKNLYNKYKNASKKPLRTYAYSNEAEFIADAYAWYYFLYIDTSNPPYIITDNYYYPNDLKLAIEKYIKIAKNGYK